METQALQEQQTLEPLHFRQEVVVQGLPYIFEGDIPDEPADFEWSVTVPNWEEQERKGKEMMKKTPAYTNFVKSQEENQ